MRYGRFALIYKSSSGLNDGCSSLLASVASPIPRSLDSPLAQSPFFPQISIFFQHPLLRPSVHPSLLPPPSMEEKSINPQPQPSQKTLPTYLPTSSPPVSISITRDTANPYIRGPFPFYLSISSQHSIFFSYLSLLPFFPNATPCRCNRETNSISGVCCPGGRGAKSCVVNTDDYVWGESGEYMVEKCVCVCYTGGRHGMSAGLFVPFSWADMLMSNSVE